MSKIRHNQRGFSAVESLLVIVAVAIIGFVGWYVFHAKQTTDKNLGSSGSSQAGSGKSAASTKTTASTDNQSLQNDLGGVSSASNQTTKDLNTSSSGLNDSSTFTSVPQ
jgi:hypothetical protein